MGKLLKSISISVVKVAIWFLRLLERFLVWMLDADTAKQEDNYYLGIKALWEVRQALKDARATLAKMTKPKHS